MEKTLGLLLLENRPITHAGALCNPNTFSFPTQQTAVPGATVRTVIDADENILDAYIRCARQLENDGVSAITSNCGFTSLFQSKLAAAVTVPVALSSLSLVPFAATTVPKGKKVGILTYDATRMGEKHFAAAGWSSAQIDVAVAGIEGSETWRRLAEPIPDLPASAIVEDVLIATRSLLKRDPDVAALVFECAAFPLAADAVRRETGLMIADYVSLAKMLIEVSPVRDRHGGDQPRDIPGFLSPHKPLVRTCVKNEPQSATASLEFWISSQDLTQTAHLCLGPCMTHRYSRSRPFERPFPGHGRMLSFAVIHPWKDLTSRPRSALSAVELQRLQQTVAFPFGTRPQLPLLSEF